MGLTQDFADLIEPDDRDWLRADSATRRGYYDGAGPIVFDELSKQIGKGIGHNGRKMKARIQPVRDDGADSLVMETNYLASPVIPLADFSATDYSL